MGEAERGEGVGTDEDDTRSHFSEFRTKRQTIVYMLQGYNVSVFIWFGWLAGCRTRLQPYFTDMVKGRVVRTAPLLPD